MGHHAQCSAQHDARCPLAALVPGLALALTVLIINLLGDALRDALDPRHRR